MQVKGCTESRSKSRAKEHSTETGGNTVSPSLVPALRTPSLASGGMSCRPSPQPGRALPVLSRGADGAGQPRGRKPPSPYSRSLSASMGPGWDSGRRAATRSARTRPEPGPRLHDRRPSSAHPGVQGKLRLERALPCLAQHLEVSSEPTTLTALSSGHKIRCPQHVLSPRLEDLILVARI